MCHKELDFQIIFVWYNVLVLAKPTDDLLVCKPESCEPLLQEIPTHCRSLVSATRLEGICNGLGWPWLYDLP
jgi:hypothetical protein